MEEISRLESEEKRVSAIYDILNASIPNKTYQGLMF